MSDRCPILVVATYSPFRWKVAKQVALLQTRNFSQRYIYKDAFQYLVYKRHLLDQSYGQRGLGDLSRQVAFQSTGNIVNIRRSYLLTTSSSVKHVESFELLRTLKNSYD